MTSRKEEKERAREARVAQEKTAADAARRRRLGLVAAGVLVAAVAAVLIVVLAGGGDDDGGGSDGDGTADIQPVAIPKAGESSLDAAAKAAGCEVTDPENEGSTHVTTKVSYKASPPTSGNHDPNPAADGIYPPGSAPTTESTVHSLEHGRINLQYRKGTAPRQIGQLMTLAGEEDGYHVLLFENQTDMPFAVAATAWDHQIGCPTFNDKIFDALRAFRARYTDQAPEQVP